MNFILGEYFHFGPGFDPARLPEGWHLIESENEFARGRDPDGREYLLHADGACPTTLNKGIRSVDPAAPIPYRPTK